MSPSSKLPDNGSLDPGLPPRKENDRSVLVYFAGVFTLPLLGVLAVAVLAIVPSVLGLTPPQSVIEGGQETEEMREVFRQHGLLGAKEEVLWCHFNGLDLETRGCLFTDQRIGVFDSHTADEGSWGASVLSFLLEDVRSIEVEWPVGGMVRVHLRIRDVRGVVLKFTLGGNTDLSKEFIADLERLCREHAGQAFEGRTESGSER